MSDTTDFEIVSSALQESTDLDRLEARGTVRLALKSAGYKPDSVDRAAFLVVLERVMPEELASRGIEMPDRVCEALRAKLAASPEASASDGETPDAIFDRIGR